MQENVLNWSIEDGGAVWMDILRDAEKKKKLVIKQINIVINKKSVTRKNV